MSGPTQGAREDQTSGWIASPVGARAVRALVFVSPILAAWMAIRIVSDVLYHPVGVFGTIFWVVQAAVVATVIALLTDRLAIRLLPLATLLGMTLTFPDQTPSRFAIALRAGTIRNLQHHLDTAADAGLSSDIEKASRDAITLVTLLGRHERLTRGHTERVRAIADLIGAELGLEEADRHRLAWASLLHDIGKLTVPPEILNKNGRPSDDEWEILKNHPAAGEAYVDPLAGWLGDWRLATSQHHERWDGTGYPRQLIGSQISLAGRIVAVADAYDVITSRRSYKAAMSPQAARHEIVRCAGTQFDPDVVRALLRVSLPKRRRFTAPAWLSELPQLTHVGATLLGAPIVAVTSLVAIMPATSETQTPDQLAIVDRESEKPSSTSTAPAIERTTSTAEAIESSSPQSQPEHAPADPADHPTPSRPEPTTTRVPDPEIGSTTATTATTLLWPSTTLWSTTTDNTSPTTTSPPPTSTTTTTTVPATTATTMATTTTTLPPEGPAAADDFHVTVIGLAQTIDVLANDVQGSTPLNPDSLRIITLPHRGTATVLDGQIRYQPPVIPLATTLSYEVCDTNDLCDQATVTIAL